jgi:ribosomal-protein-alanine N-acetyltransferase
LSPSFFVSAAVEDDLPALAALAAACFTHPWTEGQIRAEVERNAGGAVLVGRCRGEGSRPVVCGSCTYRVVADEMEILDVAVLPGWRGRGVARFLVRLALRRAARAGAGVALLEGRAGNAAALRLYARLGFRQAGLRKGYYRQPSEDAVLMRRGLLDLLDGQC